MEKACTNKLPHKAPLLCYILVTWKKEGQSSFTKDKNEVTKGLEDLTLPVTSLTTPKLPLLNFEQKELSSNPKVKWWNLMVY